MVLSNVSISISYGVDGARNVDGTLSERGSSRLDAVARSPFSSDLVSSARFHYVKKPKTSSEVKEEETKAKVRAGSVFSLCAGGGGGASCLRCLLRCCDQARLSRQVKRQRRDAEESKLAFGTYAGSNKFTYRVRKAGAFGGYKIVTEVRAVTALGRCDVCGLLPCFSSDCWRKHGDDSRKTLGHAPKEES